MSNQTSPVGAADQAGRGAEPTARQDPPSLKPHPLLFRILLALYLLSMAGLMVLYFTTVRKSG